MNIATGLSGLHAASARMDRAAATIARSAATPVSITAKAAAAEQRPSEPVGKPASLAAREAAATQKGPSESDLVAAMVEQMSASKAFMVSVNSVKRTDQALDSLLAKP